MAVEKNVTPAKAGAQTTTEAAPTVAAVVRERTGVSWSRAKSLCHDGRVTVDGKRCLDPATRVLATSKVVIDEQGPKLDRSPLPKTAIVFHDRDIVVVDKPAGMLTVADEAGNKDTLVEYTRTLLKRMGSAPNTGLGVVHRLDKDTSGLIVFTRTPDAKRKLQALFREHDIQRVYHAIAHGDVPQKRIETTLVLDRGDGLRGSHGLYRRAKGDPPPDSKRAVTHVKPLKALRDATLVECRLETGRQHQIRIHLSELGHPLVGEKVYNRDYDGPKIDAPRAMLHARTLGFVHPRTREMVSFEREAPDDFRELLALL